MPAIVWIAISIAIVMLGIGGSASFPAMPEHVFRPVVEKGFELFKPIVWALALAFGAVAAIFVYRKFFRKEVK
jgi:tryptophan-rich sensory protein